MPVIVQDSLPAIKALEDEGLFVISSKTSKKQDIRPLKIALLNLMPTKISTETQFLRLLSNTPLQIEITLLHMASHSSKNTSTEHLEQFYKTFADIKTQKFDAMIITGAPVEQLDFCNVNYWQELTEIMEYTKTNVFSTLYICWGAQAGLFYHYDINKIKLNQKCFGVFAHKYNKDNDMLLKGCNDVVYMPHSRHSTWSKNDIIKNKNLKILLESDDAGVAMISSHNARQIFISGHFEYDKKTLQEEYDRDINLGKKIDIPHNYFPNNDASKTPQVLWQADANLFFANWLNYVVYQKTPYNLDDLAPIL